MASRRQTVILGAGAAALCLGALPPVLRRMATLGDFPAHADFAAQFIASGRPPVPHFGYHLLLIAAHALFPRGGWPVAALVVTLGALLATALIVARWLATALGDRASLPQVLALSLLPLALLVVQPLLLPPPYGWDRWLIGYFPASQWHNPTTLLSKPVALLLFTAGWQALRGGLAAAPRRIGLCAALVLLSALIKPNYVMAFVPAIAIVAMFRRRVADWRLIVAGIVLPAVAFLGGQYVFYYVLGQQGAGVQFAPLLVLRFYTAVDPATLALKLLASVLFPLCVTVCFPAARRDERLALAWVTFVVGAGYAYLLAEGGPHADHGNFLWSGQLAAFVLFAVAAVFVVRQVCEGGARLRAALCGAVMAAHVISGVHYLRVSWLG